MIFESVFFHLYIPDIYEILKQMFSTRTMNWAPSKSK